MKSEFRFYHENHRDDWFQQEDAIVERSLRLGRLERLSSALQRAVLRTTQLARRHADALGHADHADYGS